MGIRLERNIQGPWNRHKAKERTLSFSVLKNGSRAETH